MCIRDRPGDGCRLRDRSRRDRLGIGAVGDEERSVDRNGINLFVGRADLDVTGIQGDGLRPGRDPGLRLQKPPAEFIRHDTPVGVGGEFGIRERLAESRGGREKQDLSLIHI